MRSFPNVCQPDGVPCPDRKPGCQGTCPKMLAAKEAYGRELAEDKKRRKATSDVESVKRACIHRLSQYRRRVKE